MSQDLKHGFYFYEPCFMEGRKTRRDILNDVLQRKGIYCLGEISDDKLIEMIQVSQLMVKENN